MINSRFQSKQRAEKADPENREKAQGLMQNLQEHYKAKNFDEVEKSADAVLKLMGMSEPAGEQIDRK